MVEFVAGMADAHVSEGVAVGSVFATEATVVPRALGGDLGCGMSAAGLHGRPRDSTDGHWKRPSRALDVRFLPERRRIGDRASRSPTPLIAAPLSTGRAGARRERWPGVTSAPSEAATISRAG